MEHKIHSLAEQVFEQLEQKILTGEYAKGELFTEMYLSKELGVSRTPVREALRRLEQEHLVELSTKGAKIVGISKKDILDMYEVRIRVEGLAARLAAEVISEDGKKELCDLVELQEFYTQKKNVDYIKNVDSEFHDALYRHCGSTVFYEILNSLHKKVVKYRKASIQNNDRSFQSVKEHRAICDAIVSGDGVLAEKLTIEHIKNARENIISTVKE